MATFTHGQRRDVPTLESDEARMDNETANEPADFELDERLRTLRLDQWFAMAEEGMPLWAC